MLTKNKSLNSLTDISFQSPWQLTKEGNNRLCLLGHKTENMLWFLLYPLNQVKSRTAVLLFKYKCVNSECLFFCIFVFAEFGADFSFFVSVVCVLVFTAF